MSVKLPEFITQELLQKILSINYKDEVKNFKVDNYWGEWATKRGENYASDMYRLHVDFRQSEVNKQKSFLLKVRKHHLKFWKFLLFVYLNYSYQNMIKGDAER
jgi:hypothetical protein